MRYLLRAPAIGLCVVVLAACAGHDTRSQAGGRTGARDETQLDQAHRYAQKQDSGPEQPERDISKIEEPQPKPEPRSRYGNKSPYTVNGHTYHVLADASGYARRGIASWYGNKFDGHLTSNMEHYDMYAFSAASRELPLPSYARVTNVANGKHVVVRVNDRGPFIAGRIIDLSYAAAVRIGIWPRGTGMVVVQGIDPDADGQLAAARTIGADTRSGENSRDGADVWLQAGAYTQRERAQDAARRLRQADIAPVQLESVIVGGEHFTRVRLGPVASGEADAARETVRGLGMPVSRVRD